MASAYKRAVAAPVRKAADNSGKNEKNHTEEIIISPYEFGADRKSTRLNSSHGEQSRMPSSA